MDKQQMISWMGLYDGNGDLVSSGPWSKVTGYMGLKFVANGLTHFGWAQIAGGARLLGWAYETRPGVAIKAGQTK